MDNNWYEDDGRSRHERPRGPRPQRGRNPWDAFFNGPGGSGGSPFPANPQAWLGDMLGLKPEPPRRTKGPRVRRGDVRTAIIDVLHRAGEHNAPLNGYQVIQEIADLSNEEWRPSPGSIYPTISQLEDEGLVTSDDLHGRRSLRLTDEGVRWAEENAGERDAVWAAFGSRRVANPQHEEGPSRPGEGLGAEFRSEITQVMSAAWQLVTQGSESQRRAALKVLSQTRRSLYGILADGRDVQED